MLFKKMVLFAIIAIFEHYYKFCDVFKMIFERKTIRITASFSRIHIKVLPEARGREKTQDDVLGYKIISLFCDYFTCAMWSCGAAMFLI
jgi:hypothetical protein